jgi:glycosyltransferase involved in cell wall biosynthesis
MPRPRVVFFVEGFTDIRFVTGLSEIAELTLCVPAGAYTSSGLKDRVAASGAQVSVAEIAGNRIAFQARSLLWLWRHAREFDVVLSQELLRGSLNATLVGALRGVPVVTTMMLAPVEYFRCRRQRGQIGPLAAWGGEALIRTLMTVNGRLSTRCVALGAYLCEMAGRYCPRTVPGGYYGVDTAFFTPASGSERAALRAKLDLPADAFVVFLASRISHEKDPETVLRAAALARERGLNAVVLNLSGGYRDFVALAGQLALRDAGRWVIGRPAAHPMTEVADYFRAADVVAQASLAEGLGLSPLEALACGVPVVATNVGGMAVTLPGVARLVSLRDHEAMAREFLWVAAHPEEARAQALQGRVMVERDWSRARAFADLARVFADVSAGRATPRQEPAAGSVRARG